MGFTCQDQFIQNQGLGTKSDDNIASSPTFKLCLKLQVQLIGGKGDIKI